VDCAKRTVAKGRKNAEHTKKDDDLKALREREDFKKLLAELEGKTKEPVSKPKDRPQ
jgi:hypothetical protein